MARSYVVTKAPARPECAIYHRCQTAEVADTRATIQVVRAPEPPANRLGTRAADAPDSSRDHDRARDADGARLDRLEGGRGAGGGVGHLGFDLPGDPDRARDAAA